MPRVLGTFAFSSNFEVAIKAPLDARLATPLKSELTGLPFAYKGMVVAVTDDPVVANNGIYYLVNDTFPVQLSYWVKISDSVQAAITLTTTGSSGPATLSGSSLNIPEYTLSGLGGVPSSRSLTINGTTVDLSADRSWTVGDVRTDSTYSNPAWITSLAWGKITGAPAFLTSFTETDPVWLADKPSYATQSYVNTQISNLVNSAPATLDTLNELAVALGNDPNFATTMATALGNRLRIDVNNQGLDSTQQANGRTNLGLGGLAILSSVGNTQITDVAWTKITGAPAFLTSEADTLATVTARGAITTSAVSIRNSLIIMSSDGIMGVQIAAPVNVGSQLNIFIDQPGQNVLIGNGTLSQMVGFSRDTGNGSLILRSAFGFGYSFLDGGTQIATLTNSGLTANAFIRSGGTATQILAANGSVITAGSGITISGGVISSSSGTSLNGTGFVRMSGTTASYITGSSAQFVKADGSLDSNSYLTSFTESDPTVPSHVKAITTTNISNWNAAYSWGNHAAAGYLTSYTETDTLQSVTSRGNTTNTFIRAAAQGSGDSYCFLATASNGSTVLGAMGQTSGGHGYVLVSDSGGTAKIFLNGAGNSYINTGNSFTFGINTTNPDTNYRLHVVGNTLVDGTLTATLGGFNSDINDKSYVTVKLPLGIGDLTGKSYVRISTQEREYGYIAQEVEPILPEAVYKTTKGLAVSYHMVNAARIDYLYSYTDLLENEVKVLQARVTTLEETIKMLGGH